MTETPQPAPADAAIVYAVQYQDATSKTENDWYVMSGRDHNEKFRNPGDGYDETTSMDEAVEIAEALVNRRSFPKDPKSRYYRRVTRSRVITRVTVGQVSATYEAR